MENDVAGVKVPVSERYPRSESLYLVGQVTMGIFLVCSRRGWISNNRALPYSIPEGTSDTQEAQEID